MSTETMFESIVVKEWQYRGYNLTITRKQYPQSMLEELARHFPDGPWHSYEPYHCGYVDIDIELSKSNRDAIVVHGGITWDEVTEAGYRYGFDCHHASDTFDYWHVGRVTKECELLADNIIEFNARRIKANG